MFSRVLFFFLFLPAICGEILTLDDLQIINTMIRQGDDAMIRLEPTKASAVRQKTVCRRMRNKLVETLEKAQGLSVRSEAAEAIRLCTASNPQNRQDFALENSGTLYTGLKDVIDSGLRVYNATLDAARAERIKALQSIAKAAEAIWILTFNNDQGQEEFFRIGAVDSLIRVLRTCTIDNSQNGKRYSHSSKAVMWSLASLQNLAATYCHSETGYCQWIWNENGELVMTGAKPKSRIGFQVRQEIMKYLANTDLSAILCNLVCLGPVSKPHGRIYAWPSQSHAHEHQNFPSIIPWAAIGFVKNLALSEDVARFWRHNKQLFNCLCVIAKRSPDWLEIVNAEEALHHLGWRDSCPSFHDRCSDYPGWTFLDSDEDCPEFEQERYCATYGETKNENGTSANEACCACGGGIPNDGKVDDK